MQRISGPGATSADQFTSGDPTTGTAPTEVTSGWLNSVQEEICAVIEDAGITLDPNNNAQLQAALSMGYLMECASGTYSSPAAAEAAGATNVGRSATLAGEIRWGFGGYVATMLFSAMVNVPIAGTVTIPTLYVDDNIYMFVDGVQQFSRSIGGPYSNSVSLTAGNHLIQFVHNNSSGAAWDLLIGEWFGTVVEFLRAAKS
jgi:hypothetical protein